MGHHINACAISNLLYKYETLCTMESRS